MPAFLLFVILSNGQQVQMHGLLYEECLGYMQTYDKAQPRPLTIECRPDGLRWGDTWRDLKGIEHRVGPPPVQSFPGHGSTDMHLYVALMFYMFTSTDPTVPPEPVSAIMHYGADDAGRALCKKTRNGLNAELRRQGYTPTSGEFVCREVTSSELDHWEPGVADAVKRMFPGR